jgi:hypothetical protein
MHVCIFSMSTARLETNWAPTVLGRLLTVFVPLRMAPSRAPTNYIQKKERK